MPSRIRMRGSRPPAGRARRAHPAGGAPRRRSSASRPRRRRRRLERAGPPIRSTACPAGPSGGRAARAWAAAPHRPGRAGSSAGCGSGSGGMVRPRSPLGIEGSGSGSRSISSSTSAVLGAGQAMGTPGQRHAAEDPERGERLGVAHREARAPHDRRRHPVAVDRQRVGHERDRVPGAVVALGVARVHHHPRARAREPRLQARQRRVEPVEHQPLLAAQVLDLLIGRRRLEVVPREPVRDLGDRGLDGPAIRAPRGAAVEAASTARSGRSRRGSRGRAGRRCWGCASAPTPTGFSPPPRARARRRSACAGREPAARPPARRSPNTCSVLSRRGRSRKTAMRTELAGTARPARRIGVSHEGHVGARQVRREIAARHEAFGGALVEVEILPREG